MDRNKGNMKLECSILHSGNIITCRQIIMSNAVTSG